MQHTKPIAFTTKGALESLRELFIAFNEISDLSPLFGGASL